MKLINQLDEITANQIAAGEVVERPASVIKELVENSIDAGATKISVDIEDGGIKLMRVSDNGCGMCREDSVMCLQRHATSKIKNSKDLGEIKTLGFRGEALPSIASVSNMKLCTCDNTENSGSLLTVKGGIIEALEDTGMSKGTSIEITNLFYNTPARLKFLKSKSTEYTHIVRLITEYALCYPNIRFELSKDRKQTLLSAANGKTINAAAAVLGLDTAKNIIPFQGEDALGKVWGYISKSDFTKTTRKDEYLFVNGRSVKNRNILFAPELIFKNLLSPGKYPVCIVFVETDEKLVDVNVHPTKSEIKFANEKAVYSLLYRSVQSAVMGGGGMHTISPSPFKPKQKTTAEQTEHKKETLLQEHSAKSSFAEKQIPQYLPSDEEKQKINQIFEEKSHNTGAETQTETKEEIFDPFDWKEEKTEPDCADETPIEDIFSKSATPVDLSFVKVISQYKNTYIICECIDGIVFIDQHVAHERVLYNEMIKRDYSHNCITSLLIPQTVSFSGIEAALIEENINEIKQIGYDLEPFGNNSFIIRGTPSEIKEKNAVKVLKEIVEELSSATGEKHLTIRPEQILISASCKKAVKAGQPLTAAEMQSLVNSLLKTDNPFTCPHNRPIIISISDWELGRKFKRI